MAERIEAFKVNHLDECAELLVATFNAEPWNETWTLDTARRELTWTMEVPGFGGLVSLNDRVLGFATGYCEPDGRRNIFYLKTFCVRPDVQRMGVGSRLLEHLRGRLGEGGVNAIYLTTKKGTPAEVFYEKRGYVVKDEIIVMTHEW